MRNVIAPERDLGHTDRALKAQQGGNLKAQQSDQKEEMKEEKNKKEEETQKAEDTKNCEDCQ